MQPYIPRYLCLICVLLSSTVNAQTKSKTAVLIGDVKDSLGMARLPGTTISLYVHGDSIPIRRIQMSSNGYKLENVKQGKYKVTASYTGYKERSIDVIVQITDSVVFLPVILLRHFAEMELKEVIVKSLTKPVTVKGDTTTFLASVFKTMPNATAEDLLAQLPGVKVNNDGIVTVNGQKVESYKLEGRDIPVKDPRSLTRVLTADMLKVIESFDDKDSLRETGITTTKPKVVNFKLKDEYQSSVTIKAMAGAATREAGSPGYGGGTNGIAMSKKKPIGVFALRSNNINDLVDPGGGKVHFSDIGGPGYDGMVSKNTLNITPAEFDLAKTNIRLSYSFYNNQVIKERTSDKETFLGDSSLSNKASGLQKMNTRFAHIANFQMRTKLSRNVSFTFAPNIFYSRTGYETSNTESINVLSKDGTGYLSNLATSNRQETTNRFEMNTSMYFLVKLRHGGQLTIATPFTYYTRDGNTGFFNSIMQYSRSGSIVRASQLKQQLVQEGKMFSLSPAVSLDMPISKTVTLKNLYQFGTSREIEYKDSYNFNIVTGSYNIYDTLNSQHFKTQDKGHLFSSGLLFRGKKIELALAVVAQTNQQENNDRLSKSEVLRNRIFVLSPTLDISNTETASRHYKWNLHYEVRANPPQIYHTRPAPDLSNPLKIITGNPDLRTETSHEFSGSIRSKNPDKLFEARLNGRLLANKIIENTQIISGGVQMTSFVNSAPIGNSDLNLSYRKSLGKSRKGNIEIGNRLSYSLDRYRVNGVEYNSIIKDLSPRFSLSYTPGNKLILSSKLSYLFRTSSFGYNERKVNAFNQYYALKVSYLVSKKIDIQSDYELTKVGAQGSIKGQSIQLWNASIGLRLFNDKKAEMRFSAFDLLNNNKGFEQVVKLNNISTTNTNVLAQTFYITFRYEFMVSTERINKITTSN